MREMYEVAIQLENHARFLPHAQEKGLEKKK